MSEDFIDSLSASLQAKGAEIIRRVCAENPKAFLQVIAGLAREELLADRDKLADATLDGLERMLQALAAGQ